MFTMVELRFLTSTLSTSSSPNTVIKISHLIRASLVVRCGADRSSPCMCAAAVARRDAAVVCSVLSPGRRYRGQLQLDSPKLSIDSAMDQIKLPIVRVRTRALTENRTPASCNPSIRGTYHAILHRPCLPSLSRILLLPFILKRTTMERGVNLRESDDPVTNRMKLP